MQQKDMNIPINTNLFCSYKNQAIILCSNRQCAKYPLVCADKNCQCRKQHNQCLKTDIEGLIKNIKKKQEILRPLQNKINLIFTQLINDVKQLQKSVDMKIKQCIKTLFRSQQQNQLIQNLQKNLIQNINGKLVWQIQSKLFQQNQVNTQIDYLFNQFDQYYQNFINKIKSFSQSIQKKIDKILSKLKPIQLFQSSKLIKNSAQSKIIQSFFKNKIINTKLLYRASQNQFQLQKFYQSCSNIPNTITISQTQFKKIIGGYTPLKWFKTDKLQQVPDQSSSSFIFSLTNKEKFELKNKKYAINRSSYNNYGPAFGNGWDFFIRDKANFNNTSGARINSSYFNQNYTQQNKQSRFLGSKNGIFNCKLLQWQVWSIQYQRQ